VLALEGMAQEALGRPADAIESYRLATARGLTAPDIAARLAALEQDAVANRPQAAVAGMPGDALRQ
jgi:hypothetical protein